MTTTPSRIKHICARDDVRLEASCEDGPGLWWGYLGGQRVVQGFRYCPYCGDALPRTLEKEEEQG